MAVDAITRLSREYKQLMDAAVKDFESTYTSRLRAMRESQDPHNVNFNAPLSQAAVADLIGTVRQNYYKIELGRKGGGVNLSVQQAIRLCILYGCSMDYLFFGREPKASNADIKRSEDSLDAERRLRRLLEEENETLKKENEKLREKLKKK